MNSADKRNPAGSVRARLLDLARARGEDFQLVLTRYGLERLMYRFWAACRTKKAKNIRH